MIGYFIDPFSRTVEARELPDDAPDTVQLEAIYALLQSDALEAIQPDANASDVLYYDEEALSKPDQRTFVCLVWSDMPIPGRALWIGVSDQEADDDSGGHTSPTTSLEAVAETIRFEEF